jgi:small subunit ribosomal protein S9
MPRAKKETPEVEETKKTKTKVNHQTYMGTGRRKLATARVWLKAEKGDIFINEKPAKEYFASTLKEKMFEEPLRIVNRTGQFSGSIKVAGGGPSAQLTAMIHGLSRALVSYDGSLKELLAKRKFLTRDDRIKERRKYGHAGKARKMKQSPKR